MAEIFCILYSFELYNFCIRCLFSLPNLIIRYDRLAYQAYFSLVILYGQMTQSLFDFF